MTHGSLFSGIGGFDYAAKLMGWENVFHCEINPFGRHVLNYYWPKAKSYEDITKTDFTVWRNRIDVLTGGFPCQPFSLAGKRKGTYDERHLWPEMCRAIREIKPRWIVGENVFGLVNWGGGLVFEQVQADLEAEGYEVQPYILPAAGVNAPHKRDRVWFVAHTKRSGRRGITKKAGSNNVEERSICPHERQYGDGVRRQVERCGEVASNTNSHQRCQGRMHEAESETAERHAGACCTRAGWRAWQNFPTQSPVCGGNDGLPAGLAGITVSKHRKESIKAYGNAIVPQVVYQIFKSIQQYES